METELLSYIYSYHLCPLLFFIGFLSAHQNVQIMGSFDGWSQGEAMSMEYSGYQARFSATLNLRPGRCVL